MPELPEVETVLRQIRPLVLQCRIHKVLVHEPRLRYTISGKFVKLLQGEEISDVTRRGKYLLFHFESGKLWLNHLGMSGRILWSGLDANYFSHISWQVELNNGKKLFYSDPRRFGFSLVLLPGEQSPHLQRLGAEPLTNEFNEQYLFTKIRNRSRDIKSLLMDQQIVAGIGNIYANEILFYAGVHPMRAGHDISLQESEKIVFHTKHVLKQAVKFQGSSISDFLDTKGKEGRFQKRFAVYSRSSEPCRNCGSKIIKDRFSGRSFYFCPECQRESQT